MCQRGTMSSHFIRASCKPLPPSPPRGFRGRREHAVEMRFLPRVPACHPSIKGHGHCRELSDVSSQLCPEGFIKIQPCGL